MRGQEAIVAARHRGAKPTMVQLLTQPYPSGIPQWDMPADWVFVEPSDLIRCLDLRFVVGCLVLVDGQDAARVRLLHQAVVDAGAQRVISHIVAPLKVGFDLLEIIDTEGVMTWHN